MGVETALRFALGGALVALFTVVGNLFAPKTFSGIFGAAPSVALATLVISYLKHGTSYVAVEGRSMIGGAAALSLYSLAAAALLRRGVSPWITTTLLVALWLVAALTAWAVIGSSG